MLREENWLEKLFSIVMGVFAFIFWAVWKCLTLLVQGVWRIACDVMKSAYGKIVAGLATLLLAGLGLQFFSGLLN